ncbi:Lrp/AsnC family transcriptional regulator [Dinghuibacter silviterrae]|uniref:DNA-binding Lrp family transcriptional regulator n=1 Tax=Dinghuibacter silviterrae TaxID=1539049 RepID=A0A4R8DFI2_9BACT|nr:Lrp/AsnC family transcriptional regulator [Dinghuibacter silviterrae]TDW96363.1 DNA-binding Lrp family transcriptional regulator [Dinghuibacter silviterrae]
MLADLDAIDIQILSVLQYDARMTTKELSAKTGKSVTAVHERIRRLEERGVIRSYVALLDRNCIGKKLIGFTTVKLKEHSDTILSQFEKEVVKFPEVMECYQLTGVADFLLKVVIADMDAYNHFLKSKLAPLPHVGNLMTSFVLVEAKRTTAYQITP